MSPDTPSRTPIVRFLGEDAGRGGPFALLGLPHTVESVSEIRKAQQRRLRQVDHHPHRTTPDADEVRLAIHSAAIQLLDPALREQLIRRWPEGNPVDLPPAWRPKRAMKQLTPAFLRSARRVIGSSGGWNPVARRRLAHLARINRVSALQVVRALGPQSQAAPATSRASSALPKLPPEPDGGKSWIFAYTLMGLLACSLMITVVLNPRPHPRQPISGAGAPSEQRTARNPAGASDDPIPRTERERLSHYTAIAHELDRLVARANIEPTETIARFSEIYPLFVEQWTEFPIDALERAALNMSEMTVRLEQQGVAPEQLPKLFARSGIDPRRVMIVGAVIEVVMSSPQLSTDAQSQLRALRERYSDSTIMPRTRITPVLIDIADAMARGQQDDDPQWWGSWLNAVKHATLESPRDRTRLVIEAMETRLLDPTTPGSNWLRTASLLSRALEWRENSAERFWLLGQFADSKVSTPRLSMLTEAIATGSAAEGIDARMVLARDANPPQRTQMAQAYRDVWFTQSRASASKNGERPNGDLAQQLELEVLSTTLNPDQDQAIDKVVALTALWVAARLRVNGDDAASEELLLNPPAVAPSNPSSGPSLLDMRAGDQGWAEQAINSESAATLRPLLDQLVGQDSIGINAAHALVYLATLRPQSEVRDLAQAQLIRFRAQPTVLLAIDHALSDTRVSARLDEVVRAVLGSQLPERTDPDWYPAVRGALLARLATSVGERDEHRVSMLQGVLHDLLALLVRDETQLDQNTTPTQILEHINTQFRLSLESKLSASATAHASLGRLEAQTLVLRARDCSPMHRYLAELWYAFEIQAIAFEDEIPGSSRSIEDIRAEFQRGDEAAQSVLQQITNTQRAIIELWILKLKRGGG